MNRVERVEMDVMDGMVYLESVGTALGDAVLFAEVVAVALLLLQGALGLLELLLVAFDALLGLGVGLVGVVEGDLQLVDVRFELLLHAQCLGLALGFGLQTGLHRVDGALVVLAGVFELFFLLLDAAVDLLAHLGQFQLSTKYLNSPNHQSLSYHCHCKF